MIVCIVHVLVFGVMVVESDEMFLAQLQEVEFVLEDNASMIESVHDDEVACLHLFFCERNLCEIVLTLVRIVLRTVHLTLCYRVGSSLCRHQRVALFVGQLGEVVLCHHRAVHTLPVVNILTSSPLLLESRLSLVYSHLVVEVPLPVLRLCCLLLLLVSASVSLVLSLLLLSLLLLLCPAFLFLFLFQSLNDAVDGGIAVGLRHLCQCLQ